MKFAETSILEAFGWLFDTCFLQLLLSFLVVMLVFLKK